jgi:hypothetical protein
MLRGIIDSQAVRAHMVEQSSPELIRQVNLSFSDC